jgi:hypothetical protein
MMGTAKNIENNHEINNNVFLINKQSANQIKNP